MARKPNHIASDQSRARSSGMVLPRFDAMIARKLGEMAVNIASRRGRPVTVSLASRAGLLFYCALDESSADSGEQIRRKHNTVLLFKKSSIEVGEDFRRAGRSLEAEGLSGEDYSLEGGGIPLFVIGTGLAGSLSIAGRDPAIDHELAVETLRWHLGESPIHTGILSALRGPTEIHRDMVV